MSKEVFIFKPFVPDLAGESGHDNRYGSLRIPCRILKSAGLIRSWEFRPTPHGRQTIAGVRIAATDRGEVAGAFNGVLCRSKVCASEFEKPANIDVDTSVNSLIRRKMSDLEPMSWLPLPAGAPTIYVQAMDEQKIKPASPDYPLLQTNLDSWLLKALQYGEDFAVEMLETTRGFPSFWINDRVLARRPWIHQPKYKILDKLFRNHPSAPDNTFASRCLEVEYRGDATSATVPRLRTQNADWTGRKLPLPAAGLNFVFGFGSLINTKSRTKSDPTAVIAVPVRISASVGFVRAWNFQVGWTDWWL